MQRKTLPPSMRRIKSPIRRPCKGRGIHQFNKQGQKSVQTTKENIVKAKDKVSDFKQKRAMKVAEQKAQARRTERLTDPPRNCEPFSCPDAPANGKSQLIKTRQQGKKDHQEHRPKCGKRP